MATQRRAYCCNCGEDIGEYIDNEPDHCGKSECARELRYQMRSEYEERMWNARDDDYSRY